MDYILYISIAIGIILSAMNFYISFLAHYIEKKKTGSAITKLELRYESKETKTK